MRKATYRSKAPLPKHVHEHVLSLQRCCIAVNVVRAEVVIPLQLDFPYVLHALNVQLVVLHSQVLALLLKSVQLALHRV